ncbi:hypothetical protein BT67DRAFT_96879 [Trichocladium antarcticum]|uniref:Uncharacterized protein n=1 Tax=Trichocladium antarcticum TaxID=1450529 RepID=A0AAN6UR32_9PEZI|nr:hypothetical protein BT67DRAFT_96879 [Trichocladium antarcticum]
MSAIWPDSCRPDGPDIQYAPTPKHGYEAWLINAMLSRKGTSTKHITQHLTSPSTVGLSAGHFGVGCGGKGIRKPTGLVSGAGEFSVVQNGATSTGQIPRPAVFMRQTGHSGWDRALGGAGKGADCFLSSLLRWATRERWCRFLKLVLLVLLFDRCPRPGPGGCGLGWDCQNCLCCVYSATFLVVPDLQWNTDYIRVSV